MDQVRQGEAEDETSSRPWRGLAGRHWRGEVGLGRALWMPVAAFGGFAVLFLIVLLFVRALLAPVQAFTLTALSWVMLLLMVWWLCAGLFRAGMRRGGRGGHAAAAGAALAMLGLTAQGIVLATWDFSGLVVRTLENMPITATIRPLNGGTEVLFEGNIEHGAANALQRAVRNLPNITLIRLNSMGGELSESRRIRDFIAARKWDTYTSTLCWSGCAIAYLGGVHRTMGAGAQMGFHSANILFGDDAQENAVNASIAQEMIDRGVDAAFARKAWSKIHDGMWFPPADELIRARFVHAIAER